MNSIRTKTTLLSVCAIVLAMSIALFLGVIAIRDIGNASAERILLLLCQSAGRNLDSYFGSVEHQVTDITLYDTEDTSQLVWYTVPKATGEAVWLPPYITDNLDVRVLSYNVPI